MAQLGDVFAKLASGQALSLEEIEFMRLQMNQAQNNNSVLSGWLSGGNVNLQNSDIVANKSILSFVPIGGAVFQGLVSAPNGSTDYDVSFVSYGPPLTSFTSESGMGPGSDAAASSYWVNHKRITYRSFTSQRYFLWAMSMYVNQNPVTTLTLSVNSYDYVSGASLGTSVIWNGPITTYLTPYLLITRNANDPLLEWSFKISHDGATLARTFHLDIASFMIL